MSVLQFNGTNSNYIEIPDDPVFSAATTGSLSVSAWMRPDTLSFPIAESDGSGENAYVHWLGKGEDDQQEWTFRMYNNNPAEARPSRISFYVFNPKAAAGGKVNLGVGAYFQGPVTVGQWIHVVGVADGTQQATVIYKNGAFQDQQPWSKENIVPVHGTAPVRIATRDLKSFFFGAIRDVRIWDRVLSADEVQMVSTHVIPHGGLVACFRLTHDTAPDSIGGHDGLVNGGTWTP
ncbi:MAG: LamG domain-containing protein [Silvibacterium sp.]|nr:LamG domain-containing protein [Silvibacterium sp.]